MLARAMCVLAVCQAEIPEECKEDFIDPSAIEGNEKRCLTLLAFSIVRLNWIGGMSEGEVIAEHIIRKDETVITSYSLLHPGLVVPHLRPSTSRVHRDSSLCLAGNIPVKRRSNVECTCY